jgi:hypothetical protein
MPVVVLALFLLVACDAAAQGQDAEVSAKFAEDKTFALSRPRADQGRIGAYRFSPVAPEGGARLSTRFPRLGWADEPSPAGHRDSGSLPSEPKPVILGPVATPSFDWRPALWESFRFLMIEHGFRMAFQPAARRQTYKGHFWKDYVQSVKGLRGWEDQNGFMVNYVGHPLQGSTTSFIFLQNHRVGRALTFENSRSYWNSRLKSMVWSAAYSTYFEIGFPFSEAALGNVGSPKRNSRMGYVDLVVTPTLGTALVVGEDAIDRYLIRRLEGMGCNQPWRAAIRGLLNPSRSMANIVRGRVPWHRDTRPGITTCQANLRPTRHPEKSE